MMALNEDILDAIRNRRYSLRVVPKEEVVSKKRHKSMGGGLNQDRDELGLDHCDGAIIARILERRIQMEYQSEDEDSGEESDRSTGFCGEEKDSDSTAALRVKSL